ncbi:unnamed protein product [Haemonchus placei]|uniref:CC domain-containing protein n=1 Tax=Haemonchus placei TaxID=6290 RepID=A0A0N4WWB9_HAEPC|nr:unnamed protein product [Haemonchus placei]
MGVQSKQFASAHRRVVKSINKSFFRLLCIIGSAIQRNIIIGFEKKCGCVQIVYLGTAQYQCQCGEAPISGPSSAQYQCNCHGNQQQYPALINDAPVVTPAPEVTETYPPITYAPELPPVEAPAVIADAPQQHQASPQYPLTTSCMVYVGVPSSPCVCLPQYDQCTQNICCLKAKFRSHKSAASSAKEPSTVDMLMNILHKIKTKLND